MTTEYFANTGNIAEAGSLTQKCEAEVRDLVTALLRRTDSTLSGWEGPAAESYRGVTAKWNASANRILESLHAMSVALLQSQENYDRTEKGHVNDLDQFTYTI